MAITITGTTSYRSVTFSAVTSETHEGRSEITTHPVESGSDVTDHVRDLPDAVTFTGFVTNTPIVPDYPAFAVLPKLISVEKYRIKGLALLAPGSLYRAGLALLSDVFGALPQVAQVLQTTPLFSDDFVKVAYETLEDLRKDAEIVTIRTGKVDYGSMVIESVSMPRAPSDGDGGYFTVTAREFRTVNTGFASLGSLLSTLQNGAQPAEPRGLAQASVGAQSVAAPKEPRTSILGGLVSRS